MAAVVEIDYLGDFTKEICPKMINAGMAVLAPEIKKNFESSLIRGGGGLKYSTGFTASRFRVSNVFHKDGGARFKANAFFDNAEYDAGGNAVMRSAYDAKGRLRRRNKSDRRRGKRKPFAYRIPQQFHFNGELKP